MPNQWNLPDLGVGLGLRGAFRARVLADAPSLGFFELLTENHLDARGARARTTDAVAARYPVVLHGVSLNVGSIDALDGAYVANVKALADRIGARWVSDHLSWTSAGGRSTHDLLPVPYTEATLEYIALRVREVSERLERPLILENPSSYVAWTSSSMREEEFLARLCERADCGLLLDINNVYVSARNHGFDAEAWLDAIPVERVAQIHLAGHTDKGTHLLDTHAASVAAPVWALYERFIRRAGPVSTLIEWDEHIPPLEVLMEEVQRAEAARARALTMEEADGDARAAA